MVWGRAKTTGMHMKTSVFLDVRSLKPFYSLDFVKDSESDDHDYVRFVHKRKAQRIIRVLREFYKIQDELRDIFEDDFYRI